MREYIYYIIGRRERFITKVNVKKRDLFKRAMKWDNQEGE